MAMRQGINFPLILTIGVTSVLLMIVIVLGAQAWYYYEQQREQSIKWSVPQVVREFVILPDLQQQQRDHLTRYEWNDANKSSARIPVAVAEAYLLKNPAALTAAPATRPAP
jgi:hypothetical protein